MKRYIFLVTLLFGCASQEAILRQAEQASAPISTYPAATNPSGDDTVIGVDVDDLSMSEVGTTKKYRLRDMPISDLTQAALSLKQNILPGVASDGSNGLIVQGDMTVEGAPVAKEVEAKYEFTDASARDAYFIANPTELIDNRRVVLINTGYLQRYILSSTSWINISTIARGPQGVSAPQVQFQYSIDGSTSWHSTWTTGDLYSRSSVDGGTVWSVAIRIAGPDGTPGDPGDPGVPGDPGDPGANGLGFNQCDPLLNDCVTEFPLNDGIPTKIPTAGHAAEGYAGDGTRYCNNGIGGGWLPCATGSISQATIDQINADIDAMEADIAALTESRIPILSTDPVNPGIGQYWINSTDNSSAGAFKVAGSAGIYSIATSYSGYDIVPSAFSFTAVTGANLNTQYSATMQVLDTNSTTTVSIAGNGGQYRINGGVPTSAAGTAEPLDYIEVFLTSSGLPSTLLDTTLTVGGVSAPFNVTTAAGSGTVYTLGFDPSVTPTSVGTSPSSFARFVAGNSFPALSIRIFTGGTGGVSIIGGVYADNGATPTPAPSTLIEDSEVGATVEGGWACMDLNSSVSIVDNTPYFIGYLANATISYYYITGTNLRYASADSFASGLSDPFNGTSATARTNAAYLSSEACP